MPNSCSFFWSSWISKPSETGDWVSKTAESLVENSETPCKLRRFATGLLTCARSVFMSASLRLSRLIEVEGIGSGLDSVKRRKLFLDAPVMSRCMECRDWRLSELLREVGLCVSGQLAKSSFSCPEDSSEPGGDDSVVEFPESVVLLKTRLIGLLEDRVAR